MTGLQKALNDLLATFEISDQKDEIINELKKELENQKKITAQDINAISDTVEKEKLETEKKFNDYENALNSKNKEIKKLQNALEECNSYSTASGLRNEELIVENAQLQSQITSLQKELKEVSENEKTKANQEMETKLKELKENHEKTTRESLEKEANKIAIEFKEKINNLEAEKNKLQQKVKDMEQESIQKNKINKESDTKISELTNQVSKLRTYNSDLQVKLDTKENEIIILKEHLKEINERLGQELIQNKLTDSFINMNTVDTSDLKKQIQRIKQNNQIHEILVKEHDQLKIDYQSLKEKHDQLVNENTKTNDDLKAKTKELNRLNNDIKKIQTDLNNKSKEIEKLTKESSEQKGVINGYSKIINDLRSEINQTKLQLQTKTIEIDKLGIDLTVSVTNHKLAEDHVKKLENELQQNENYVKTALELQEKYEKNSEEYKRTKEELKTKTKDLEEMTKMKDQYRINFLNNYDTLEDAKNQIEQLKSELNDYLKKYNDTAAINKSQAQQIDELQNKLEFAINSAAEAARTNGQIQLQQKETIQKCNSKINELNQTVENYVNKLKQTNKDHNDKIKKLNSDHLEKFTNYQKKCINEMENYESEKNKEIETLELKIKEHETEINKLKGEINEKNNSIKNQKSAYDDIVATLVIAESKHLDFIHKNVFWNHINSIIKNRGLFKIWSDIKPEIKIKTDKIRAKRQLKIFCQAINELIKLILTIKGSASLFLYNALTKAYFTFLDYILDPSLYHKYNIIWESEVSMNSLQKKFYSSNEKNLQDTAKNMFIILETMLALPDLEKMLTKIKFGTYEEILIKMFGEAMAGVVLIMCTDTRNSGLYPVLLNVVEDTIDDFRKNISDITDEEGNYDVIRNVNKFLANEKKDQLNNVINSIDNKQ